jgi:hypothetical protein
MEAGKVARRFTRLLAFQLSRIAASWMVNLFWRDYRILLGLGTPGSDVFHGPSLLEFKLHFA